MNQDTTPHAPGSAFRAASGGADGDPGRAGDAQPGDGGGWPVVALVAAGGVAGALARYGIGVAWPSAPAGFAWATWTINITGCFLIGVLVVLIERFRPQQRLLRPFWGAGVLGGYTTFSAATVDVLRTTPGTALSYLAATLAGALAAVWLGTTLTEALVRR